MTLFFQLGCKKDKQESTNSNKPPITFQLLDIPNDQVDVDVLPTLTWEKTTDPDNDAVLYDLFLQTGTEDMTLVEKDLEETSYTFPSRLKTNTHYKWRVEAKDGKGGVTAGKSDFSFTTRAIFNPKIATKTGNSIGRGGHSTVVYKDKIWVIGGEHFGEEIKLNDIWNSSDGINWQNTTVSAAFSVRTHHSSVVFDNKMWVIGGSIENFNTNQNSDIWYSEDGKIWTQAAILPFKRYGHLSLIYDNKIWMIGGYDKDVKRTNDVWHSDDGRSWIRAIDQAAFSPRAHAAGAVFKGKMWLIGGEDKTGNGSVWYSEDGKNWVSATDHVPFGRRSGHSITVFDNKMWLIGGSTNMNPTSSLIIPKSDIWYSEDGINWIEFTSDGFFTPRQFHSSIIFKNKLWMLFGGFLQKCYTDIWSME